MTFPAPLLQTLNDFQLRNYPSFTGVIKLPTAHSVADFFGALTWAWLLLASFTGWGKAAGKLFRISLLPVSVASALGIAVVIFFGGLLNLIHAIYAGVLMAIVGLGILFNFRYRRERPEAYRWTGLWNRASIWPRLFIVITLLILIFRVAATVRLGEFRVEDDAAAYLVFPQKMLAAHHFVADPFSDRRVISSVGGAYLLQAIVIAATSLPHIGMADRSLGLILMFLALLDLGIAFGLSPPQIAVMELIAYLVPQQTFNLTFSILPISLFLAMIWAVLATLEGPAEEQWRHAALLGMIGGAILSLKSTYLPYMGAVALIPYVVLFWPKIRVQACRLPIIAGLFALMIIVFWMIAMKRDSGTYLYPILGYGVDYGSYHLFPTMTRFSGARALVRVFLQGVVLLVLTSIQYISGIRNERSRLSFSVLIAAALAITAFNYESGGDYVWRYNFPQFFTALIVFFAAQAATYNIFFHARKIRITYGLAIASLISCIFYYDIGGGHVQPFRQMKIEMRQYRCNLRASLGGTDLVSPAILSEYAAVESSLPPGAVALDNTTNSFLLPDRSGRTILLDDWPGAASPRPGWPFTKNMNAVSAFLSQNSIRYLIYGYDYTSWLDMRSCQAIPNQAHFSQLDHALEVLSFVTHRQFDQLRASHKSIYDDGKIAIIDLASPIAPNRPLPATWTLNTSQAEMCSRIAKEYIAKHPAGGSRESFTRRYEDISVRNIEPQSRQF